MAGRWGVCERSRALDTPTWTKAPSAAVEFVADDLSVERERALMRLRWAARGGPEWCAAMDQLEEAEAKLAVVQRDLGRTL